MGTSTSDTPRVRVLIVDDEENQRLGLAGMIASWGFVTETACDGEDALEKLPNFQPHVMLTDLRQPLAPGARVYVTLEFERAGRLALEVPVVATDAAPDVALGPPE